MSVLPEREKKRCRKNVVYCTGKILYPVQERNRRCEEDAQPCTGKGGRVEKILFVLILKKIGKIMCPE
jgi:hypothetical protein